MLTLRSNLLTLQGERKYGRSRQERGRFELIFICSQLEVLVGLAGCEVRYVFINPLTYLKIFIYRHHLNVKLCGMCYG